MIKPAFFILPFLLSIALTEYSHIDGPYVSYKNDHVYVQYIRDENGNWLVKTDSTAITNKKDIVLQVNTDVPGKTFSVKLKSELVPEPPDFPMPSRQLVLSDIEGNFAAFTQLLLVNKVIDNNYNWTFGNGHLVLTGDFVDRGEMVTEVHWLIYSLEEKAKAAGGYVHYILGNHEIMNMGGDLRYLNARYKKSTAALQASYDSLYGEHTELGKWLRTKNIMERIGHNLFIHAGISDELNMVNVNVKNINKLARPFYDDTTYNYPDKKLPVIFSDYGPFWYRGYYTADKTLMQEVVQRSLDKFGVRHIFTGHTIVGDNISTWYNGRVINTDVHHAEGKSEAVLIEGKTYYRVTNKGEKFPLEVH